MRNLGTRMRMRLKTLYKSLSNKNQIKCQTTNIYRTIQSAFQYSNGFFGSYSSLIPAIEPQNSKDDYLLKFPDLCEKFIKVFLFNKK